MSKNFETWMEAKRTSELLDPKGDVKTKPPAGERDWTASSAARDPASPPPGVRRRSWGSILADLLGDASLKTCRSLGVCPAGKRDGAASVAAALGEWMIQYADAPILLVEANLRHPDLARIVGAPSGPGLTEAFFEPGVSDFDVIHRSRIPGLNVLPAGSPVSRQRRKEIGPLFGAHFQALQARFPNLIINLPAANDPDFPSFPFALADAVLLVVAPNRTSVREVQSASRRLAEAQAKLVASMLSDPESLGAQAEGGGLFSAVSY